ncbi:MAG: hypothetical protein HDQ88_02405 [Clostridia bacterium]|nr:hypothetical protein [Clostridia bacterium]
MKDFKSYSEEQPNQNGSNAKSSADNSAGTYNNTVELAKVLTKAMNGKSESQILHTVITEAERGKREGTLTNQDLDNFYNALAPFLDGFKKRKLKEVIIRLKSI